MSLARASIVGGVVLALAGAAGGFRAAFAEPPEAAALVAAMSRALRTLDYEGTFVHLQGTHVSSLYILHDGDEDGERERMVSLDGEAREVIRDRSLVTCIWPGTEAVVVSKAKPRRLLPDVDAALADNASYAFALAGRDRVAGLATDVVEVRPHDEHRYGYRFWIDTETRMLLRSMLLDGERVVEQVLFTSIEYPERIDPARFEVAVDEERMSWLEPARARARAGEVPGSGDPDAGGGSFAELEAKSASAGRGVRFEALPAGYAVLSESVEPMNEGEAPIIHVMVSDGMASVSVYVDRAAPDAQDLSVAGLSSMGAMNAYGLSLEGGFVTVVGEVPPVTVRAIAKAVRLDE